MTDESPGRRTMPSDDPTDRGAASGLRDYETDRGNVVIYDPKQPLGWIEIDPDALVEVRRP